MHEHLVDELDHFSTKTDMSMYISIQHGKLDGISGVYVDNILRTGTPRYRLQCSKTHVKFDTTGDEEPPLTFSGFHITIPSNFPFTMDQTFYIRNLEELNIDSRFLAFRSTGMKLAWLASTLPDMLFEISQLAQVTEEHFNFGAKEYIKRLNSSTKYAHNNMAHLLFRKLDMNSVRLVGYSDAAFSNNRDRTSQLGRIILLTDEHDKAIPIVFKSYKSRRVTRSVLSAEVIAFAVLSDDAFAIRTQFEEATCRALPMHLLTDSKSLFDIISKGSRTNEKRIMVDIYSARQSYQAREISNIGFVRSENNIADGLTKPKMQSALLNLLHTGRHQVKCEQWIIRPQRHFKLSLRTTKELYYILTNKYFIKESREGDMSQYSYGDMSQQH